MKCLTVLQPWASAIVGWGGAPGPKRIENRSWRTNHRGDLLIHAGKGDSYRGREEEIPGCPSFDELPRGYLLGVAKVIDCVPVAKVKGKPFAEGPYCWILDDVRPFSTPILWKGAQMLYDVPDEVVEKALQLARA